MAGTIQLDKADWNERLIVEGYPAEYSLLDSGFVEFGNDYVPSDIRAASIKWGQISPLDTTQYYVGTGTTLIPAATVKKDLEAVIIHCGAPFTENNIEALTDGEALNPAIQKNMKALQAKFLQNSLVSCTKGAFAAASASAYKSDLSGATGTAQKISHQTIMEIQAAKFPGLIMDGGAIFVHQDVYNDLSINGALTYVNEVKNDILRFGQMPLLAGYRIIVNNKLCVKTGTTNATYTSYLVKNNPFWINNTTPPEIKYAEDILTGGGTTNVVMYMHYACAPAYASWAGTVGGTLTKAILETGTNWEFKTPSTDAAKIIQITSRVDPTS